MFLFQCNATVQINDASGAV